MTALQQIWDDNRENVVYDGEFLIGDLAVYGPPYAVTQVCRCLNGGSSKTSRWSALTDERQLRLAHRPDLLVVVRPLQVAAA